MPAPAHLAPGTQANLADLEDLQGLAAAAAASLAHVPRTIGIAE